MLDNISATNPPVTDSPATDSLPAPQTTPINTPTYNVYTAQAEIIKHYDRQFKKLLFVAPSQVIDGCIAEYYDDEMKVTVATCRIRFRNQYSVDTKTGDMAIVVDLTDLSFKSLVLNVSSIRGVK